MRVLVNHVLDWQGVPVASGQGKRRRVTYADILRTLEPINEGRDAKDRITYDSLWVHAKRHHDLEGIAAYWAVRIPKDFVKAFAG